jgi:hypothetical protein
MAHFAELDTNNKVIHVTVVGNSDITDADGVEQEQLGIDYLKSIFGESRIWKQTSYNTFKGEHASGTAFRKNYASIGSIYDSARNAFIPKSPFPSWVLNEDTCNYDCPKAYPTSSDVTDMWEWNEDEQDWVKQ